MSLPASGRGGSLVVLDGVTPPEGDYGCVHPVAWFTARLGGALLELSTSRPDTALAGILSTAIRRTADAHRDTCDLSHVRTPQATVVLVRWGGAADPVEHLVLADSTLLIEEPGGKVRAVVDDRVDRLPRDARRSHAGTDALRNAEGGFFTAAADPAVAERALTGSTPGSRVRSVAALTDGAARWVDMFGAGDWARCLGVLREEGAERLLERVRELETSGAPARSAVLRWKLHDDATAVFAELG
ncbi:protein phosphatase 2C domain-containing protein [Streptomyces yaizuensis]|uniref:Protein phosphatase 2C domain-containing protein n=1 Tax=Streptomyces yaizuensis TaxID=2989713 RepID=A0ABQ5NWA2_9ACTN|nr:protein phosphatase 2C domain-containing protein [Streptomyces sp. YSPA8]